MRGVVAIHSEGRPRVIIGGPPCLAFSGRNSQIGLTCARVMADVLEIQVAAGRFVLLEKPKDSRLSTFERYKTLRRKSRKLKEARVP